MPPDMIALGAAWFLAFLFSATCHEAAHAWIALKLGDPTAFHGGQVSLSPGPHIRQEPIGMVVIPLASYAFMGWAIGWASAPYDPDWADRHPRRAAWMALAGPAANLLIATGALLLIWLGRWAGWFYWPGTVEMGPGVFSLVGAEEGPRLAVATFLGVLYILNLLLCLFNLMPVPPLDGSSVLALILPDRIARKWREFLSQGMFALLGLLIAWKLFQFMAGPVFRIGIRLLFPDVSMSFL